MTTATLTLVQMATYSIKTYPKTTQVQLDTVIPSKRVWIFGFPLGIEFQSTAPAEARVTTLYGSTAVPVPKPG